ncbi:NAD(P)/FAD-dependent oxidoreductase [Streptomyces sp. NP160]|uniref:flavin-containing monooxygenase n=1 Tax=Streptomyces sp. NP160 TaxID=2586637 RepID=UPI0015D5A585|nr:NAD(P)/FAD-dependent oxidoreductase [Streptomyces sp. NP160]
MPITTGVRVAVVGAGPSGLSTAAVLTACGHDVVLFEAAPDLGGVWSATRAYPGVATQDDRTSYAFSDTPMPADLPDHPSGEQVRAYLHGYARSKGLLERLHLDTRVVAAEPTADGWRVTTTGPQPRTGTRTTTTHAVDWLVVAGGVFSAPHVPDWPGREQYEAAGGRVLEPTRLGDGAALAGRRVVVVGWGKTACDVAVASAATAASTTVLARALRWKVPRRLAGGLTFRHLLLTRAGEHLLAPRRDTRTRRALALAGAPVRRTLTRLLGEHVAHRCGLRELGLLPSVPLPHTDSLVTDGFFEAVRAGRVAVRREASVRELVVVDGEPHVLLADGQRLPADVVVAATGFDQDLSLLSPAVRGALLDDDGVMALDRRILPLRVPRLAFAGWGNTYRSPLTAEVGAVWLAAHLAGELRSRRRADVEREAERYHLTHRQAAAHGEPQLPSGSFAALDQLLSDLRLPLPRRVRWRQWTRPLTPDTYAHLLPALQRRLVARGLLDASVPRPRVGERADVPAGTGRRSTTAV